MKRLTCLLLAIILTLTPLCACANDEAFYSENFKSSGILIYEARSDSVLFVNNHQKPYSPGSITKLLTCLVMLENMSLDEKVTATSEMLSLVEPNSSLAGIVSGESLTVGQLVYAMLLPSGNDASKVAAVGCGRVILGDKNAKTKDAYNAFIKAMNDKAAELGMTNSNFTNSDGYDDPESYSTAEDVLKLAMAAYSNETISEIAAKSHRYLETNRRTHNWYSTNMLLYKNDPDTDAKNANYDSRVKGLKTGFTDIDGRCFSLVADDGEMVIYGVFLGMGFTSSKMWSYIKKTVSTAYDSYYTLDLMEGLPEEYTYNIKNYSMFSDESITLVPADTQENQILLMNAEDDPNYISFMIDNPEICTIKKAGTTNETGTIKLEKNVKEGDIVSYMLIFDADGEAEIGRMAYVATKNVAKYNAVDFIIRVVLPIVIMVALVIIIKKLKEYDNKIRKKDGRKTT